MVLRTVGEGSGGLTGGAEVNDDIDTGRRVGPATADRPGPAGTAARISRSGRCDGGRFHY
jgi:hypothetical protein